MHGDGEAEPDEHARGVELHRLVHELLELGERDDVVEDASVSPPRQPEERGVQVDVLAPGQLGVEAGAELEQRGEPSPVPDDALRSAAGCRRCTFSSVVLPEPL